MSENRLKFRVWNPLHGLFVVDGMTPLELMRDSAESLELLLILSEDDCIWQQSTGVIDKNGKEIYEGDLILGVYNSQKDIALVHFNDDNHGGVLGWNLLDFGSIKDGKIVEGDRNDSENGYEAVSYYYGCSPTEECEVVGNIFNYREKV